MKKIAIFHPSTELYGADRIMVAAAKAMKDSEITIYLPKTGSLIAYIQEELEKVEIKIVSEMPIIQRSMFSIKGVLGVLRSYKRFKTFILKEVKTTHYDLFYVNTLACCLILPALRKLPSKKISHIHEIIDNPKIVALLTTTIVCKFSDKVICVSDAVKQGLSRQKKRSSKTVIVLRNGIDPIPEKKTSLSSKMQFHLFGRIKEEKGQWYLLEALKLIPRDKLRQCNFNLIGGTVAGKEFLIDDLKEKIQEAQLSKIVRIKGFVNDISLELSKSDVCLVPSLMKDPFPTTVLEAMSMGKVVIASNTGGAKEAISNDISGYIIPPDNPSIFARVILNCILDKRKNDIIGEAARQRFNENFTTTHFQDKWNLMIESITLPKWE